MYQYRPKAQWPATAGSLTFPRSLRSPNSVKTSKHVICQNFKRSSKHNADRSFARMSALAKSELKTPLALSQGLSQSPQGFTKIELDQTKHEKIESYCVVAAWPEQLGRVWARCLTQIFCFQIFRRLSHLKLKLCIPLQRSTHKPLHNAE